MKYCFLHILSLILISAVLVERSGAVGQVQLDGNIFNIPGAKSLKNRSSEKLENTDIDGKNESDIPLESTLPPNPPTTVPPPTTKPPTTTTPSTTTTTTTTKKPTTKIPTTVTPVPVTTPNATISPPTTEGTTTVTSSTPPSKGRRFDGPSFIGGIILASGLMAIGFVSWKFYKARTERLSGDSELVLLTSSKMT